MRGRGGDIGLRGYRIAILDRSKGTFETEVYETTEDLTALVQAAYRLSHAKRLTPNQWCAVIVDHWFPGEIRKGKTKGLHYRDMQRAAKTPPKIRQPRRG